MSKRMYFWLMLCFISFCLSNYQVYASDNFKKAWNSFNSNDYKQALVYCNETIGENGNDASDALILKAIISDLYYDENTALESMKSFIKSSNEINPYIFGMWFTRIFGTAPDFNDEEHFEFWEELVENPKINGTIKAWTYELLSVRYKSKYKFDKAKQIASKLGSIADWQIAGTFENISGSGFDNDYGPLTNPEPQSKFTNKNGAEVSWFNKVKPFEGGWLDLTENFSISNSIIFAQTFFDSDIEGIYQFRIGTSGSLKVWMNDKLVINVPEERNNGLDTYIAKIQIHKGTNRILLQIGMSEINRCNYLARITDLNGEVINGLKFSAQYKPYIVEKTFESEIIQGFAEEYFNAKIKCDSTNLLNYLLLAKCLEQNEKLTEDRNILLKARKLAPNSSYILSELSKVYYRLNDRTNYSLVIEKIREIDPDFPSALIWEFEEALQNEKFEDAAKYLKKLEDLTHYKILVYPLSAKLYANEKKIEQLIEIIEKGYQEFPDSYDMVSLKYVLEKNLKNELNSGISVLEKYVEEHYNISAISSLTEDYKSIGNSDKCNALIDDVIEINPNEIGFVYYKANSLFDSRAYQTSADLLKRCIEIAPYEYGYRHELGNAYKEMNKTDLALDEYNQCIKYNPYHYLVREKIRTLNNKKPLFDYLSEPDLYKIFKDNQSSDFNKTDNAVVLINQTNKVVYSGGASEERTYLLVKVLSSYGIDNFKEYSIFTYPNQNYVIEKAEVLKSNGEKLKAVVNDEDIVFSNLSEGDAILLIYKTQNYQFGALSKHFWSKKFFDSYYPCLQNKFSMIISPDVKFDYHWSNSEFKPEIKNVDDFVIYNWERTNKKMINSEMYMPYIVDFAELLDISTIKNWDFVSKWYFDIVNNKANSCYETKEVIREIFPIGTPKDKLKAAKSIYEYIVKNIRYSYVPFLQSGIIPQKASDVINSKLGDCKDVSTLFVALCREVGIEAGWLLVCTRDYGQNYLRLPSIDFNHCISTVEIDKKKYYVELTSDKLPFGTIYGDLFGSLVLEINNKKENTLFKLNPEDRTPNSVIRNVNVKFDNDNMVVNVNTLKTGGIAANHRSNYRDLSFEEQKKVMSEAIGSDYPQISLLDLKFDDNLNTISDSCTYLYSFKVDNVFTSIGGLAAFKIPFIDGLQPSQVFSTIERKYPFDFYEFSPYDSTIDIISISIPKGMVLFEKLESVNLESEFASYSVNYFVDKNEIKIKRKLTTKNKFVKPDEFSKVKDFFQNIYKNDSKQIAFKKI